MKNKKNREGIVYSTNPNYDYKSTDENEPETLQPQHQKLYVRREVRNGKATIVIKEFIGKEDDLKELGKKIKSKMGVGGSVKDGEILIQGELKDKVVEYLNQLNYKTKG